ncbi:hypothetical protein SD70_30125 [Gordoniibacillus kamchatkensis]|uniref:ABC transporter domain-containing protein n=1 Tax=Gordoniibacillus kamchatkensis TaxID=1590651 RepID=A0ABR5AA68_9BACL|nr:ATP-binding cassette domain-containing protein [Paenibacillus sp. VKM B-2647]KIL37865.1 hypothetical protein SD70_30125 [Paenibacillus sp. VKM B-2647]
MQQSAFSLRRASVAFHTPQGVQPALRELDLTVAEGEWVALVGRNGSGKSTLAHVLAGLCPLSAGTLTVREGLRTRLVLQDPEAQIVGETVFEDIAFGLENASVAQAAMQPKARSALQRVGLGVGLAHPSRALSGGQKQLLAAAGSLALDADALVLDEATSMLDPLARRRLLETMRSLHRQGMTVVWVTQLLEETAAADRVIALENGSIVFDGDSRAFFYGWDGTEADWRSPCERLGFMPPYAVQVGRRLLRSGYELPVLPIVPEQLGEAVTALCRS